ncbi:hypothetical protein JOQ06_020766 [Pogonophryne albipinna]|uniref:Ig-like domain-containing protein n=1 Tax=Pogonophryne albipinna TaxID=1090488 RepID=A0AAD6FUU4_9TELE|nr:hypothetical protein JOQ06_020766 [Pogonophryne albipinna]
MRNSNVIAVLLLCSLSWICVSSESQTVDVSPGEEVTLLCSNFSSAVTQIMWFRVVKRSKPRCVSHMFDPLQPASFSTYLDVQEDGSTKLLSYILYSLIMFLIVIVICMAVKIKKLQKANVEEQNPQPTEVQGSDDLIYAAVTFRLV